jgi:hypothetical protein
LYVSIDELIICHLNRIGRSHLVQLFFSQSLKPINFVHEGIWYAADGTEIGQAIWGEFAKVQEVSNETGAGEHGVSYLSPYSAGFGRFSPK